MFKILRRLFRVAEANTHSALDKLEDPIKMTEQGIRDLKKDLETSLQSLAEAKAVLINMRKEAQEKKNLGASYEEKAVLLLQKAQAGGLSMEEADRLASAALAKKAEVGGQSAALLAGLERQEGQTQQLERRIQDLKMNISRWENELVTLKARSQVAQASSRLNKQLAQVDESSTLALLEKMKTKVAADEALAESYSQMAQLPTSVDAEIERALQGGDPQLVSGQQALGQQQAAKDSLAALKARLNLGASAPQPSIEA